jgi:hypothetical protein
VDDDGIRLDTAPATRWWSSSAIRDGALTDAHRQGQGRHVRALGRAIVHNLDANTIEVTWAGYPQDENVGLLVAASGDGVLLGFGQNAPYPNTDAMGADRVLVLTFAEAVSADQVVAEFTTADD